MSADNFELILRHAMKAYAAEIDATVRPAPPLRMLLTVQAPADRPDGRVRLRLGLAVAGAAVLALGLVSGSMLFKGLPTGNPVASVTPSAVPSSMTPSPALLTPPQSLTAPSSMPATSSELPSAS